MPVSGCQLEEQDCSYLLDLSYAAWGKAGQVIMLNLFEARQKGPKDGVVFLCSGFRPGA